VTDKNATVNDMVTKANMPHIVNMLKYRELKQNQTDKPDPLYAKDKMILDKNIADKIDTTKQTYAVTATETDGIKIDITNTSTKTKE